MQITSVPGIAYATNLLPVAYSPKFWYLAGLCSSAIHRMRQHETYNSGHAGIQYLLCPARS